MTVQCTGCSTKYLLGEERVPEQGLRVRCPKCKTVFRIYRARVEDPEAMIPAGVPGLERSQTVFGGGTGEAGAGAASGRPIPPPVPEGAWGEESGGSQDAGPGGSAAKKAIAESTRHEIDFGSAPSEDPGGPAAAPEPDAPGLQKERERAKRLAKVLVSDILIYNREKRDQALAEGKLMAVLGPEIKKSWETYKEKVNPKVADSTNYFKDALNEILADGKKVF